ncbi:MAG TPA: SAF domain-containing protein, partial [Miltoncostaeaceae bacterium]|nr:SAF domain-containing protein [Miltoncostaeaceae bacterium]
VTPLELAEMVQACNRAAVLRGDPWIGVRDSEQPARQLARRSIVLERDVVAGQPLTLDDLGFKRPGTGMAPFDYDRVIGRTLKDASPAGTVITEEALA